MTPNNENIFLSSVFVFANKAILWGDNNVCSVPFQKFKLLSDSLDYALLQYENEEEKYSPIVKALIGKLDLLRYECPDICNHKLQLS